MKRVAVVVCYQEGTSLILEACLNSIKKHTKYQDFDVLVVSRKFDDEGAEVVLGYDFAQMHEVDIGVSPDVSSKVHGMMLDHVFPALKSELILTLDSDCFPVADGWLNGLVEMVDSGAEIAGILHPWSPPPSTMKKTKIEWRVRSQHCWNVTHVACQLVRKSFIEDNGLKYNDGDDTGLSIPMKALEMGKKIDGYKITRCPMPMSMDSTNKPLMEPEFNRYVCLVFGDMVYHQGGYSRKVTFGDEPLMERSFGWAMNRVMDDFSADFLLDERLSYEFTLDREEDVAAEKMQRLFGLKSQRMQG